MKRLLYFVAGLWALATLVLVSVGMQLLRHFGPDCVFEGDRLNHKLAAAISFPICCVYLFTLIAVFICLVAMTIGDE